MLITDVPSVATWVANMAEADPRLTVGASAGFGTIR